MFRHVCQGKKIDESSQKGVSAVEILRMIEDFKARDPPEKSILGGKGKGGGRKKEDGGFRQTQSNTVLTTIARRGVTSSASCIPKRGYAISPGTQPTTKTNLHAKRG